jgi:hypothetical protein
VAPAGAKGWLRVSMCQIASAKSAGEVDLGDLGPALFAEHEGCQNRVHSCRGPVVLVQEAAEAVAAADLAAGRLLDL